MHSGVHHLSRDMHFEPVIGAPSDGIGLSRMARETYRSFGSDLQEQTREVDSTDWD
jgi:hypothetical protein